VEFIIVGCFLYSWKVIIPDYQNKLTLLSQVENETKSAKTKLESLDLAKGTLNKLGDIVDKMFVAIPSDKDTPNLITELEAIADKQDLILPGIQISEQTSQSETAVANGVVSSSNAIPVSFTVEGSFTQLNNFIAALEKDVRFMNITSISVLKGSEEEDSLGMSIQLEVFKRTSASLSAISAVTDTSGLTNNDLE